MWVGPRPSSLSLALISRKNHLTSITSRSSIDLDNLHHWSVMWDLIAIVQFRALTSTFANSPKAWKKVVFRMLRVDCRVESCALVIKLLPALRACDKPFTTLLSELKEFSSFCIIISRLFFKITRFHISMWYASISFDQTIVSLVRWSPSPMVWTNHWFPHHLLHWHHQDPVTLSQVATYPIDVGIDFLA